MINQDTYIAEGLLHKNEGVSCQDYAMGGHFSNTISFIAVADGCSGALANTDIGARVITAAFLKTLAHYKTYIDSSFVVVLKNIFQAMKITTNNNDYLTTLVAAVWNETNHQAQILMLGDGVVHFKINEDTYTYIIMWDDNMPFYLHYDVNKDVFNNQKTIKKYKNGVLYETIKDSLKYFILDINDSNIEYILVATDGIEQIKKNNTYIDILDIISNLTSFKSIKGSFLKRRCIRALKNYTNEDVKLIDDIGIGVLIKDKDE